MQIPRTHRPALNVDDAVKHLEGLGVATEGIRGRAATRKRGRSLGRDGEDDMDMDVEDGGKKVWVYLICKAVGLEGVNFLTSADAQIG